MKILSHRGFWRDEAEKNAPVAFRRTVREGFGTETDVRDHAGRLVVSHDPADDAAMDWRDVVALFEGSGLTLAVNVKADGLARLLADSFRDRAVDWFAFDMSAPETLRYARAGLPFFTRHSDIEPAPILYADADGVWLDAFERDWFDGAVIETHLRNGKKVCVVSPDLHGRPPEAVWRMLARLPESDALIICTDRPDDAQGVIAP